MNQGILEISLELIEKIFCFPEGVHIIGAISRANTIMLILEGGAIPANDLSEASIDLARSLAELPRLEGSFTNEIPSMNDRGFRLRLELEGRPL